MPRKDLKVGISERSPLIIPQRPDTESLDSRQVLDPSTESSNNVSDDSFLDSKSSWYLILLTLGIGGLQIVWSVELSHGSPYLLSLGMSKSLLAFVWLAGPMTGVLVQPYIGIVSDRCKISWGRRKPFILGGTIGTVASSLLLAYSRQIVGGIGGFSKNDSVYAGTWQGFTIVLATVMMWCLDFSVNTVQASIRAFIVDGAPAHQQEAANAWASRIVGVGNVLGYIFGYLNLPRYFHFLGTGQFQVLCAIASIVLVTLVGISILSVPERNPNDDDDDDFEDEEGKSGLFSFFKQVWTSIQRLPAPIYAVCEIQFFNWMGLFPFLFYITTYIGQLYVNPDLSPALPDSEVDELWARATRIGTLALLIYAIVSLITNVFAPFLIVPTYKPTTPEANREPITPTSPVYTRPRSSTTSSQTPRSRPSHHRTSSTYSAHTGLESSFGELSAHNTKSPLLSRILLFFRIPGLTLRRAWMLAQLLFAGCMFSTFFINSYKAAIVMVSIVGVSWSLTLWAPFALISAEIGKRDEARRVRHRQKLLTGNTASFYDPEDAEEDRAGIILGLHNVAVSAPQVVSTLVCSGIFKALQKPRNVPGDNSVAWALRFGGCAVLISAWLTWRMRESVTPEKTEEAVEEAVN